MFFKENKPMMEINYPNSQTHHDILLFKRYKIQGMLYCFFIFFFIEFQFIVSTSDNSSLLSDQDTIQF